MWEGYTKDTHMVLTYSYICEQAIATNGAYSDICEKCKRGGQCVVLKFNEAHTNSPSVYIGVKKI